MKSKNLLILTFAAALIGCSNQSLSPDVYSRSDAQKAFRVTFGEVVDVMPVPIEGEATNLGTTAGAAVGYGVGRDATDDGDWSRTAGAVDSRNPDFLPRPCRGPGSDHEGDLIGATGRPPKLNVTPWIRCWRLECQKGVGF